MIRTSANVIADAPAGAASRGTPVAAGSVDSALVPDRPSARATEQVSAAAKLVRDDAALADAATPGDDSVFIFPASPAQRRFWLLDQLQPGGNPALNMPMAHWLEGPLDVPILQQAFNEVIRRHESLRTTFQVDHGVLQQIIAPPWTLQIATVDVQSFPADERDRVAPHLIEVEAATPFDLAKGPLLRAQLVQVAREQHFLLLTLHHIITDGWSNGIILREVVTLYGAFLRGETSPLAEPTFQFADFSEWQTAVLADENAEYFVEAFQYWREQLGGKLPVLDLPTDRPRAGALAYRRVAASGMRTRVLPDALVDAIRALANQEGASPFMVYLAAFEVLLHRYTGQTDLVLSTPLANRDRPELENVVGPFVNPLILRADLTGDPSVAELLLRVRRTALDAYAHGSLPFERLVEELSPEKLQVTFFYQPLFIDNTELAGGLKLAPLPIATGGALFEISTAVLEHADGTRVHVDYNAELYDAATIERLLGHFQTLLEAMVLGPTSAISQLRLLTAAERRLLTGRPADADEAAESLPARRLEIRPQLAARVIASPDAIAARHGRRELSCAELLARLEIARDAEAGVQPGSDLVQAAAWLASWRTGPAGGITFPGSPPNGSDLLVGCQALRERAALQEADRLAAFSPPGSLAAAEEAGAALLAGATLVYPPEGMLAGPLNTLAAWLDRERITVACLPAAAWHRFAAAASAGRRVTFPGAVRLLVVGEGSPDEGTLGRVVPGKAEDPLTSRVCSRLVLESAVGTVAFDGRIIRSLGVLDLQSEQPVPVGVAGELSVFRAGGAAIARTGELARWRGEGEVPERLGLRDQLHRNRGFRVDLRRVETALCTLPGIRHAIVRPWKPEEDSALIAWLLPDSAATQPLPNRAALRRLLQEGHQLPNALLPAVFVPLSDVPIRAIDGRLDHAALPAPPEGFADHPGDGSAERTPPYLALHHQLIAIWEEVLGVSDIGIRDDFFDLGGNSLQAMRMLRRIEQVCGKMLLPATLFTRATVEHLAEEIARQAAEDAPTLLRINDEGSRTPFFYLHGDLSGGGFYSLRLSRALGGDQPFYALPPQDVRTLPAAPSIEAMAAEHLRTLRSVRPHGPYVIGGFCIGGLVAYELARQLEASGERVEMLVIIDASAKDRALWRLRWCAAKLGSVWRWDEDTIIDKFGSGFEWRARLKQWCGRLLRESARIVLGRLWHRCVRAGRTMSSPTSPQSEAGNAAGSGLEIAGNSGERNVPNAFLWATAGYRACPYEGSVALLLSSDLLQGGGNLVAEWQALAPAVTVHPLAGSHLECITAHVDALAGTVQDCLERAAPHPARPMRGAAVPLYAATSLGATVTATAGQTLF